MTMLYKDCGGPKYSMSIQSVHQANSEGHEDTNQGVFYQAGQGGGIYLAAKAAAYLASLVKPFATTPAQASYVEHIATKQQFYQASGGVSAKGSDWVQTSGDCHGHNSGVSEHAACQGLCLVANDSAQSVTGNISVMNTEQDHFMKKVAMVTNKEETEKFQGFIQRKKLEEAAHVNWMWRMFLTGQIVFCFSVDSFTGALDTTLEAFSDSTKCLNETSRAVKLKAATLLASICCQLCLDSDFVQESNNTEKIISLAGSVLAFVSHAQSLV